MSEYMLEVQGISKSFPGVRALDDVSLKVKAGEIHALIGENGAGKSTLMKILNGNYKKDSGAIYVDGQPKEIRNPVDARKCGISIVFQELNLIPILSIAENIFMGRLPKKNGIVDRKKLREDTVKVLDKVKYQVDPFAKVQELGIAQRQMVEIARALSYEETRIILMDEPSATLTATECEMLFAVIRALKKENIAIIYISHKIEELMQICDYVTIIRDGRVVDQRPIADITPDEIVAKMVGREVSNVFPKRPPGTVREEELLRVENYCREGAFSEISFTLKKGEVLGFAGLVGAGRTEIARAIFGIDYRDGGDIYIRGQKVVIEDPAHAIKHGICYLSEDRKAEGLMGTLTVAWNLSAASLKRICRRRLLSKKKETARAKEMIDQLQIKTPGQNQIVFNLSGGNMQKIVVGKWLSADIDVFIFDEPTRGIDVGAKYEIYLIINRLAAEGKSVIMISSELPEVMGMSDRILVIREGKISAQLNTSDMTAKDFIEKAI